MWDIVRRTTALVNLQKLLRNHPISPLNQRNKYRRVSKLRSIVIQICLSHSPRTRACATSEDLHMLRGELIQRLSHRWPPNRSHSISERLSHQPNRLSQQKNLHLMSRLRKRQPMQKRKRRLGWIIRAPRALHHNFERLVHRLSLNKTSSHRHRYSRQLRKTREELSTYHKPLLLDGTSLRSRSIDRNQYLIRRRRVPHTSILMCGHRARHDPTPTH